MFGMGFSEIVLIAIVAILFLGPDKLPDAMVQIAKFLNSFKKTINEAKSSFEEEIHIRELKEEALRYRRSLEEAGSDISGFKNAIPNPVHDVEEALGKLQGGYLDGELRDDDDDEAEEEPVAAPPVRTERPSPAAAGTSGQENPKETGSGESDSSRNDEGNR